MAVTSSVPKAASLRRKRSSRWLLVAALGAWLLSPACALKSNNTTTAASDVSPPPPSRLPAIDNGPWMDASLAPSKRSELLLKEMTQDEKLTLVFGYYGNDASWRGYSKPEGARPGSAGYIPGIARLGIPPQWQTDAGVGVATQGSAPKKRERTALASGLALAATWDPDLAEKGGAMIGAEARASGFNVMLAGGVNLLRDAYCGRNFEYGGEDPLLAGLMVGAQIKGIQSQNILSTVKHFAINDQETDRDKGNSVMEEAAARSSDLLAFELAIEKGHPGAIMCAYNRVNGHFSCENRELLTELLRKDWGYPGFVLSDWGAVHSTVKAANAGLDQQSGYPFDEQPYFQAPLKQALADKTVPAARFDEMVTRILQAMFTHGLFEHPVSMAPIPFEEHALVSQEGAEQGAVLLKNKGQLLPLSDALKSIAVIGGHADKGVLSGGGSSQVYPHGGNAVPGLSPTKWPGPVVYYPSSPLAEIKKLAPKSKLSFDSGKNLKTAVKLAQESEVAIVFVTQWTTESIDAQIVLPDQQDALVSAVAAANPRTIVVLETGGPVLMPWAADVSAIVELWYPGTNGGKAIANLLFGRTNPSGHLPMSIAKESQQLARPEFPKAGEVRYTEGATVGYKWFDLKKEEPLFAFGHGLSYTSFEYKRLQAERLGLGVSVRFTVKNTGTREGKDVAQIYVSRPGWEAPQRLGAFQKVDLKAGESTEVRVEIDPRWLATWDTKGKNWHITAGELEVLLGSSSREIHEHVSLLLKASSFTSRQLSN